MQGYNIIDFKVKYKKIEGETEASQHRTLAMERIVKAEGYVNETTEEVEGFVQCLNANLPFVVEKIEELREICGRNGLKQIEESLKNDLERTIKTMKELFENSKKCYLEISDNNENEMKSLEKIIERIKEEKQPDAHEEGIDLDAAIQEVNAKIQSKFSQIDRNINAIQDSLINIDGLFSQHS